MHLAQRGLSRFLPFINCSRFKVASQAILWLLRRDTIGRNGCLDRSADPIAVDLVLPEFTPAKYRIFGWDTSAGSQLASCASAQD